MKQLALALGIGTMLLMSGTSYAASHSEIVGTWRLVSMTYKDQNTGREVDLWGKRPLGLLTYTRDGRMSAVLAASSRKISTESADQATTEEQAMLYRKSVAYAGRYTLTAEGAIHHVEVATDPTWIGQDLVRILRLEGRQLVITAPPLESAGKQNQRVLRLVWERVE